jgi:lysophospholipase L1-like esterase
VSDCRLGVLAFGDSITNGGGELQWGVALQSWALWVARALGRPYSGYAVDGATARDVVAEQIPAWRARAGGGARYDVGCLYVGVNDVRGFDWDAEKYSRHLASSLRSLREVSTRILIPTIPLDLGRPRAGAKVQDANAVIESAARSVGALVVDLRDFGARNQVMVDHVHPTAFGQVAMAERALHVLEADGESVRVWPSSLIRWDESRWRRLRGDATYAYRHAKVSLRAAALVARHRVLGPPA